jgi:hypothetical protein
MNQEIEVKNLDHLGIVAGIVDELGIVDLRYLDYHSRHLDNGTLSENGVADARRSGNDDERGQTASRGKTFDVMDDQVCYLNGLPQIKTRPFYCTPFD